MQRLRLDKVKVSGLGIFSTLIRRRQVPKVRQKIRRGICNKRYVRPPTLAVARAALEHIITVIGPNPTRCCTHKCEGCRYEIADAIQAAKCALLGHSHLEHYKVVFRAGTQKLRSKKRRKDKPCR